MNKIILMGRLTAEPTLKYSTKDTSMAITKFNLAVDRKFVKKDSGNKTVDFIRCVAFGKGAEFASKFFHKGQRVMVEGRLQIGEYTNKDGQRIPTADVIIESQYFADAPKVNQETTYTGSSVEEGFVNVEGPTIDDTEINDDELPFS